ncbi:MAG TPA: ABC transporter permease [Jiangellaceae bacterium]|jgi:ABC-2 type transport system permease protein|nr:ABC transporter permease [Jiangellaceae bacterium]
MSTLAYAVRDSRTMLRRNLRRMQRYPMMTLMLIGIPAILLLLFVYVFGGTMGAGIGGSSGGRAEYANYVLPGILLISIATGATGTATSVAMDMTEGIVARFKTMAIYRPSVLSGHVLGSVIQTVISLAVLIGVALLVGFRPDANPGEWFAAAGFLVAISVAITWLSVALGLASKTVEGASNLPMPLILLPFLGSGFVPTESMPTAVQWFADYQPFTPIMETVRGLLLGTAIGINAWIAAAWCVAITVVGYVWAKKLYNRDPSL